MPEPPGFEVDRSPPVLGVITQRLFQDDWLLGWTVHLVEKLAERSEHLHVFPLYGEKLPHLDNVTVRPFGGDPSDGRLRKLLRLQWAVFRTVTVHSLDGLLIHQNHLYAPALYWAKAFIRGPFILFRAHGQLPPSIRYGLPFLDRVVTSAEGSFDYPTGKKTVISQPVDLDLFEPAALPEDGPFRVISAGRISPVKGYEVLIRTAERLQEETDRPLRVDIYGEPARPDDREYLERLKRLRGRYGLEEVVRFRGSVPFHEMPEIYRQAHLFVNCPVEDSALDKVVLEAMAVGRPVVSTNPLFAEILDPVSPWCRAPRGDPEALAEAIRHWMEQPVGQLAATGERLREVVTDSFSLNHFVEELVRMFTGDRDA